MMLLVLGSAVAQQAAKERSIRQEVSENTPQAVLNAVEKDNQGFQFQKEATEVAVIKDKKLTPEKKNKDYTVYTKKKSLNGKSYTTQTAFYDEDGSLVSSRSVLVNRPMPQLVLRSIGKAYNGWLMVKAKTVIEEQGEMRTVFYDVVVQNGKSKERILLNEAGQIVKSRRDLNNYSIVANK